METIWASTVLLFTLVNAGMISASTMMAAPSDDRVCGRMCVELISVLRVGGLNEVRNVGSVMLRLQGY